LVSKLNGKKPISDKWIYKEKKNVKGEVEQGKVNGKKL
jgi:hypothetical protein